MIWVRLLQIQRDLLEVEFGAARFRKYLATMLDEDGSLSVPLAAFNPMSKPHVATLLDELLALDAEGIGERAVAEADRLMRPDVARDACEVGLVIADDAQGGWTNRWLFEAKHHFESQYEDRNGMVTALLWSSERADARRVRERVMAAVFRYQWRLEHGRPVTLGAMLAQEGAAARFAGVACERLPLAGEVIVAEHLATTHYPTIIACLYGDDVATACGYTPLGLPPEAGLRYALAHAR